MLVPVVNALFVYGTLRSNFRNPLARRLLDTCGAPEPATMPGRLLDLGTYPGLVESQDTGETVHGEVYHLTAEHADLLAELDEYEDVPGGLYARKVLNATLANGMTIPTHTYVYLMQPAGPQWIPGGDYTVYLRSGKAC